MPNLFRFLNILFTLLLILWGSSAYAGCTVNGTTESGAISKADLKTAIATRTDDITTCNVSSITNMTQLFVWSGGFNQDISSWDVSNVIHMDGMFYTAESFNQDISDWDVSSVMYMQHMFLDATAFNNGGEALDWSDTSTVRWMQGMFAHATSFNQDIGDWNVSSVWDMSKMFYNSRAFNQDIGDWNVSSVGNMASMFRLAIAFNQDIGDWNVSSERTMKSMFKYATAFNQDISDWNVSSVTNMSYMFQYATAFNQNISSWDMGNVTNSTDMFTGATAYNANPTLSSSTPADGATGVAVDANIVLTFNEAVDVESGNIVIKKSSDDSTVETIAVTDSKITGTGTTEITINPSSTLASSTGYYLNIAATAFDDGSSNSYAGITDATTLNFTIADINAPTLSSSTPADGATGVAVDANIVLTFNEAVDVESGNITIKKSADDSTVETIDVTGSKVTGTGTTEITINPSSTLASLTGYYLNIAATAFDDGSSNSYAGITDATTLNFTVIRSDPTLKKDVIGSIEAWSDISSSWANSNIESAHNRIDWLNRHKGSNQTSHQGIKLNFVDTLINSIMNSTPGAALRDIDASATAASLINNSDGSASEVGDNAEQKATDIAINEAARLREGLIGSLNPSFGPVTGNWSVWTEGEVIIGKTDASTTASKKKASAQAISLGFDRPIGSGDELMGFVFSAGQSDTDIGTASTNVKSKNFSLSNYNVFKTSSGVQIESVFGLGRLNFDTTRTDGSDTLTGTRKANQLLFSSTIRPQNTINLGNWHLSHYTKVSLANTRLNSFSESGAATALTFNKQQVRDTALGVGFDINTLIKSKGNTIKPFAKIEYTRSSSKTSTSMHYNNEDASIHTYTTSLNKNNKNWKMRLGLDLDTESGWDTSVSYTREQSIGSSTNSKNSNSFSFNAGIKF